MIETWEEKAREWLKGIFGDTNEKRVKNLTKYVERTNAFAEEMEKASDEDLQAKTAEFKQRIDNALADVEDIALVPPDEPKMPGKFRTQKDKVLAGVLEDMLPEAFAVVREVGKRRLNMRHFDVQILGGSALHLGKIAEMRTGEGKTLVATLPVYLNALAGRGVHVVTVNDYLAKRDAEWMGEIYKFLGMSVGLVYSHQPDAEKVAAYRCDITYGTNHEFGFDYLRDNMRTSLDSLVQRPYYYSIVDEVDNILIDEARTPLIISGFPTESLVEIYQRMAQVSPMLHKGKDKDDEDCDYWVDEKTKNILITERGIINSEKILGVEDLYDVKWNLAHYLSQALRAKECFKKDTDYVIRPNDDGKPEVTIVDEFTGRMMVGRRWSDGLHQAIEAKENVPIQEETLTYASITYQNLFRLYPKLAGMTGTAMTEAPEFSKIYNLEVVSVPTNRPNIRKDHADVIYKTERQKYYSVVEEIVEMHQKGRPVLVGTTSIEKSEVVHELLSKPQKMGDYLKQKIVKVLDHIKRKNLEGQSINQLKKLFERPGLIEPEKLEQVVNEAEKEFPKADELLERLYSILQTAKVVQVIRKGVGHSVLNAKYHEKEATIVAQAGRPGGVTVATNMAGRGTDILLGGNPEFLAREKLKKEKIEEEDPRYEKRFEELVAKMKAETDRAHDQVIEAGGLHIIGTERHESRRIDNQLRGRAARQGDPGSSRFFLSLEDNLMRIFGGEKIAQLMDFIQVDEEMPIESGMVSKSIEGAQKKVEAHHFDARKHVLQYDDVLNTQREVIYRERRKILEKDSLREEILDLLSDRLDMALGAHIDPESPPDLWEEEGLPEVLSILKNDIPMLEEIDLDELSDLSYDDLRTKLWDAVQIAYEVREEHIGEENMRLFEREVLLRTIDAKWVDYLHEIDKLREGIGFRGWGQKDPLQEYKKEAFLLFNTFLQSVQQETILLLFRAQPVVMDMEELEELSHPDELMLSGEEEEEAEAAAPLEDASSEPQPPVTT